MTDKAEAEAKTKSFDGEGNEIIGEIRVIKVMHDEGADRPFHLEIDIDDGITGDIVKYGSEIFGHLDLLSIGLRGALIERLARSQEK